MSEWPKKWPVRALGEEYLSGIEVIPAEVGRQLYVELKALRDAGAVDEEEDMESVGLARYEREVGE
jgi:hypothetical protein